MAKSPAKKSTPARKKASDAHAPRGIFGHIWQARKGLRQSFDRQISLAYGEETLLFYVAISCLVAFIADLPSALAFVAERAETINPVTHIAGRFVAFVMFGALFLYGLAAFQHVIAKYAFSGSGDHRKSRIALFWALILGLPLILLQTIADQALTLTGNLAAAGALRLVVFGIWLWIWLSFVCFAEGFSRMIALALIAISLVTFGGIAQIFG